MQGNLGPRLVKYCNLASKYAGKRSNYFSKRVLVWQDAHALLGFYVGVVLSLGDFDPLVFVVADVLY